MLSSCCFTFPQLFTAKYPFLTAGSTVHCSKPMSTDKIQVKIIIYVVRNVFVSLFRNTRTNQRRHVCFHYLQVVTDFSGLTEHVSVLVIRKLQIKPKPGYEQFQKDSSLASRRGDSQSHTNKREPICFLFSLSKILRVTFWKFRR